MSILLRQYDQDRLYWFDHILNPKDKIKAQIINDFYTKEEIHGLKTDYGALIFNIIHLSKGVKV
jgi:hypothetical protein